MATEIKETTGQVRARRSHLQIAELRHGEVGGVDGLAAFFAADAHADLGLLDHRHVVGPVADGQSGDVTPATTDNCRLRGSRRISCGVWPHEGPAAPQSTGKERRRGQGGLGRAALHQTDHESLLLGTHATGDDALAQLRQSQQLEPSRKPVLSIK